MEEMTTTVSEPRTTMSLSLTVADKKALKSYAIEHDMTVAAVIHEWIQEKCKVNEEK